METSIVERHAGSIQHVTVWSTCCKLLMLALAGCSPLVSNAQQHDAAYKQRVLEIQQQIETGDLESAHAAIESASRRYPADGGLENLLGIVQVQQGDVTAARQSFLAAIQHDPHLASAYLNLSRVDMQTAAQDPLIRAEALRMSEKVVEIAPSNDEAHYQIATIYVWEKSYARSLAELERLSLKAQRAVGAQSLRCQDHALLDHRKATEDAVHALVVNADLNEQDIDTCISALRIAHRADLIIDLLTASEQHRPLSPTGLRMLGLAQEADGKLDQARATLEKAFASDSTSVTILIDLTRVARAAGDNQGALGYLAHARDLRPKDATLPYEFGVICQQMGLLAESRKAIAAALAIDPENPEYNFAMGQVVSYSEDPSQAMPYLQKYHALRPQDPKGILAFGSTLFRAKDYDTATLWLKQATQYPPTAAEAHYFLGRIERQEGNLSEAINELKQSLRLDPNQANVLAELGQIANAQEDNAEAAAYLNHSVRIDPDNYAGNYGLLQLYARTNDPRREQQAKRFEEVKQKKDARDREMMRSFEIRPGGESNHPQNN